MPDERRGERAPLSDDDELRYLILRKQKARELADQQLGALREAYRWYLPERYSQMVSGGNADRAKNARNRAYFDHIYDPIGGQSLEDGAGEMSEALHPLGTEWIRWKARSDLDVQVQTIAATQASLYTLKTSALLGRSNFSVEAPKAHIEALLTAGFLKVDIDPENPKRIRFESLPAYRWAIEEGTDGRICALFTSDEPRVRSLMQLHPQGTEFSYSAETEKKIGDPQQQNETIAIDLAYFWDYRSRLWVMVMWETDAKHIITRSVYRTCPIICYRLGVVAGQVWGSGPAIKVLPTVKACNLMAMLQLQNANITVNPMWQADDDGVINVHTLRLVPGTIVPIAAGSRGLQPLQPPGNFEVSVEQIQILHEIIRRSLMVAKVTDRPMTYGEYADRKQLMLREMRGYFGPLTSEFAEPLGLRLIDLAGQMGEIETGEIVENLVEMEMTGPLAQDIRSSDLGKLMAARQSLDMLFGQPIGVALTNFDTSVGVVIEETGADPKLFKSSAERQQLQAMMVNMLGQQVAHQRAQAAGGAVPNGAGQPPAQAVA